MDELAFLRFGGGFGFDLPAIIAFLGFAVMYLITPVVTRTGKRPIGMAIALYIMVGYAALSVFQLLLQWVQVLDGPNAPFQGRAPIGIHILFGFAVLKLGLFVIALLAFVSGLNSIGTGTKQVGDAQTLEKVVDSLRLLRDDNIRLRERLDRDDGASR
jgi:hypothetical protein